MTSEQRMILRRHHAAYQQWGTPKQARDAAIRIALAIGMKHAETARFFGIHRKTVWIISTGRRGGEGATLAQLRTAREVIARAERTLAQWRGRERAAMARVEMYGYPIPESMAR
jgi:hypothetical protein